MKKNNMDFGGIIKHSRGYGFKLTFNDTKTANKMKKMLLQVLKNKGYIVDNQHRYHDELTIEQEDLVINMNKDK